MTCRARAQRRIVPHGTRGTCSYLVCVCDLNDSCCTKYVAWKIFWECPIGDSIIFQRPIFDLVCLNRANPNQKTKRYSGQSRMCLTWISLPFKRKFLKWHALDSLETNSSFCISTCTHLTFSNIGQAMERKTRLCAEDELQLPGECDSLHCVIAC